MLRSLRTMTGAVSMHLGLASYRRMPPPSRLPEIDIEDAAVLPPAAPRSRPKRLLRGLAAMLGAVRR